MEAGLADPPGHSGKVWLPGHQFEMVILKGYLTNIFDHGFDRLATAN